MKDDVPFNRGVVDRIVQESGVDFRRASIRDSNRVVNAIEKELGVNFIRMEFGIPGLPACDIGIQAEVQALTNEGVASQYAPLDGIPCLKQAVATFVKQFLNLDVGPECCIPTVGNMQGGFLSQAVAGHIDKKRDTILFIDPGFSVNKIQTRFLGLRSDSIDFYGARGPKLIERIAERLEKGDVGGVLWNSPNNPAWIVFTEDELKEMGRLFNEFDVVAIDDLAYLCMDFRQDYSQPGREPYPPTIAHYTDNTFLLISASKIFSYAGQRAAVTIISPSFINKEYADLEEHFGVRRVGDAYAQGGMYPTTASVPQGSQYAMTAMFEASSRGEYNFVEPLKEYGRRAAFMKKAFTGHGFSLVYDMDLDEPIGDGFYFTVSYPGLSGGELLKEIVYYGLSATTLEIYGSCRTEGLRICVSLTGEDQFEVLTHRLERFQNDHPVAGH